MQMYLALLVECQHTSHKVFVKNWSCLASVAKSPHCTISFTVPVHGQEVQPDSTHTHAQQKYGRTTTTPENIYCRPQRLDCENWYEHSGEKRFGVDTYIDNMMKPVFKFDEIALLCYARMYHRHIFIMMECTFWTSHKDNNVNKCHL